MAHLEIISIRKNSKKLPAIWEKGTNCQVFTLIDGFTGRPVALRHAREDFEKFHGRLSWEASRQRYTMQLHSNMWYYFDGPDPREL